MQMHSAIYVVKHMGVIGRSTRTLYLIPNFLRIAVGMASLWTRTSLVLYCIYASETYQMPLYSLFCVPQEFLTI